MKGLVIWIAAAFFMVCCFECRRPASLPEVEPEEEFGFLDLPDSTRISSIGLLFTTRQIICLLDSLQKLEANQVYIISDQSTYGKLFKCGQVQSIPGVDFTKQTVLLTFFKAMCTSGQSVSQSLLKNDQGKINWHIKHFMQGCSGYTVYDLPCLYVYDGLVKREDIRLTIQKL